MKNLTFLRKRLWIATSVAAGLAANLPLSAYAADVKVDVTGSNIKRVESEGALPVQIITRADLEREGIQNAAGVVERLSSNSSIGGLNLAGGQGGTNVGYVAASLRGLGSSRTLVLLNGRRTANTAFSGTSVDVNSIPLSAIDRVEVLTDGASAVYGTDAIAGVINFILRKDFTGAEAYVYYGDSEQGGGQAQRYNVSAGWGDLDKDKFNVFGTVDYQKYQNIAAAQREFSKTAYLPNATGGTYDKTSGNSIPGNVFLPPVPGRPAGVTISPGNPACLPPFSFPTLGSPNQCRFDYASIIDIQPPAETWNVFGSARWQFAPDHQAFFEGSWSQTQSISRVSPPPISSATILSGDRVLTVPGSPFYPTALATQFGLNGQPLEVFWRGLDLGPRTDQNTIAQSRFIAGLQGVIKGWDYTAAINWAQSTAEDEWLAGWSKGSTLLPILNSGRINLFGRNTGAALDELQTALIKGKVLDATGTAAEFDVRASNEIWQLPAGPMSLALGGTYRHEQYEYNSSQATTEADVPGFGGSIASIPKVSRNVYALYAEVNVPIVKNLEANLAVRYDDYQGVGNTTNPKLSLRWQPTKEVLIRGSVGTGFRAPSLPELFQPAFFGSTGGSYDDPLRCPLTGSPRDCNAQFTSKQGGNPDLKPERSTQYSFGGVWEPVKSLSVGADYWYIKIKDVIGAPGEEPIFTDIPAAEAAGLLIRYAPGSTGCPPQPPGVPCPINYSIQTNVNLNQLTTSGIDVNAKYNFPKMDWGQVGFNFSGSYYIQWDQQAKGGEVQHLIGTYAGGVAVTVSSTGSTGAFPRWKHNANLTYAYGPWQANLNQTYVHSYSEPDNDGNPRTVGSYSVYGLHGTYSGFKNLTLALGVKNLMDTNPPYTRQAQSFQIGYDAALTDPTGRFWYGSVNYAFK